MPIKLSPEGAMTLVASMLMVGIVFQSVRGDVVRLDSDGEKLEGRVEKLEYGAHEAEKERDEAKIRDEYTVSSLRRIEEWIKEITETKTTEYITEGK